MTHKSAYAAQSAAAMFNALCEDFTHGKPDSSDVARHATRAAAIASEATGVPLVAMPADDDGNHDIMPALARAFLHDYPAEHGDNRRARGMIYAPEGDALPACFEHCPHVYYIGRGHWELVIGNQDWRSSDFHAIESTLRDWARDEGYPMPEPCDDATLHDVMARPLAAVFSRLIREELTTDELREVRRVNAERNDSVSCATQDVRDANMIMLEAYTAVMGDELDTESELQARIWNQAWDMAKASGFTSDVGTLETLSKELEAYCATHGIPYACALELSMSGEFPSHAAWLQAFCERWAIVEEVQS